MKKALINVRIYDYDTYIENGFVVFGEAVEAVGPMAEFNHPVDECIDGNGLLVLPGFVLGHTHIYSTFARGLALPFNPHNFQDILDQLWWKIDRQLDNDTTYHSAVVYATDALKNGITTIIDHHASGQDIEGSLDALTRGVVDKVGLRGMFCFESSDRFDIDACIRENQSFIDQNHTGKTAAHFGLHASMSLSDDSLVRIAKARKGAPIHVHVAESELDQENALKRSNARVVKRLDAHGLLGEDALIVHGLHLDEDELDILKDRRVTVALNVGSNMNNAVGLPLYRELKARNIPVIVGNDGLSTSVTNEYLTLMHSMHLKDATPLAFGLDDMHTLIETTYAYASRRLGIKLGKICPGYAADLIALPYDPPTPMNETNALGHLVFGMFAAFKVKHAFVGGECVLRDYAVPWDEKRAYGDAREAADALWNRIRKEG